MLGIEWDASMAEVLLKEFITSHATGAVYECGNGKAAQSVYRALLRRVQNLDAYRNVYVTIKGSAVSLRRESISYTDIAKMREELYSYPENRRAKELTAQEQLLKVMEEVGEVANEYLKPLSIRDHRKTLHEIEDVRCALDQLEMQHYLPDDVRVARLEVLEKGRERGDWT